MRCYAVEAVGLDTDTGTIKTYRFATTAFVTGPRDTPADTVFPGRIQSAPNYEAHLHGQGKTRGPSTSAYGDLVAVNLDGSLDDLRRISFDGRSMIIRVGEVDENGRPVGRFPQDWETVIVGTIARVQVSWQQVVFSLRDKQAYVANQPIFQGRFAGDNALPNGLEGVAADLKDRPYPRPWGEVKNVTVLICNTQKVIGYLGYQGPLYPITVNAVDDKGAVLTLDATAPSPYTTIADLLDDTKAPAAGKYKIYPGTSTTPAYVRFGSTPNGLVTATIQEGTATDRTVAQIVRRILTGPGGLTDADLDLDSFAALDAVAPYTVGWWAQEETIGQALDALCASVGAHWICRRDGKFVVGRLDAPTGASKATFTQDDLIGVNGNDILTAIIPGDDGGGIPPWKINTKYDHNWSVQTEDALSGLGLTEKGYRTLDYRSNVVTDATVQAKWLLSPQIDITTELRNAADAATEGARLQGLIGVRREMWRITIDPSLAIGIWLKDIVTLQLPRFGMDDGRKFRVIGIIEELNNQRVTLFLWG